MQPMRNFQFVFKECFNAEQLAQITFIFHQGEMVLNIAEDVSDTASVQTTEVQVEWKLSAFAEFLGHRFTAPLLL